jgi:hypothetical protein
MRYRAVIRSLGSLRITHLPFTSNRLDELEAWPTRTRTAHYTPPLWVSTELEF